jgi:hypothetical protein
MGGLALALGFSLVGNPALPKDVIQYPKRDFQIPFNIATNSEKIEKLRLFVSADRGKTWKHVMDRKPDGKFFKVSFERDFQQYWLAIQTYSESGAIGPAEISELQPGFKIYINPFRKLPVQRLPTSRLRRQIAL